VEEAQAIWIEHIKVNFAKVSALCIEKYIERAMRVLKDEAPVEVAMQRV